MLGVEGSEQVCAYLYGLVGMLLRVFRHQSMYLRITHVFVDLEVDNSVFYCLVFLTLQIVSEMSRLVHYWQPNTSVT